MAATSLNSFKNQKTINIVAENVRYFRTKLNLTQLELAVACDIDIRQIQRIEYSETDTKVTRLEKLAEGLNVTIVELVTKR